MVVALHRRRCPLLVFRIFPLLPYIRRASSRHLGLVGSSSLALPPLFGCLFRYNFSSFDSGVVSRLRAIETRTGVSILRMQGLVGSFRHGCRDRLVSRRGTLHCSLRRGPLNFLRSLSSLAPLASAGPLLGMLWLGGSCGHLGVRDGCLTPLGSAPERVVLSLKGRVLQINKIIHACIHTYIHTFIRDLRTYIHTHT